MNSDSSKLSQRDDVAPSPNPDWFDAAYRELVGDRDRLIGRDPRAEPIRERAPKGEKIAPGDRHLYVDFDPPAETNGNAGADVVDILTKLVQKTAPQRGPVPPPPLEAEPWERVNLAERKLNPPEPPAIGDLLYPGRRHLVSGEAESGKSWLLLALAAAEIRAGHGVGWVDVDGMGPNDITERLTALGVDDEQLGQLFAYYEPNTPLGPAGIGPMIDELGSIDARLLVFDSFNPMLNLHGLDPNATVDVDRFWRHVVDPFKNAGLAPVLIDHVTKSHDGRGKYAYGSERKHSGAEVHLGVTLIHTISRGATGKTKLTVNKDRPGFLPRPTAGILVLDSDADTGACAWKIVADTSGTGSGWRPTGYMEKVSRYLELCSEPESKKQITEAVTGKADAISRAIDCLRDETYLSMKNGQRGSLLFSSLRPYREVDDEGPPAADQDAAERYDDVPF
jgi:hypothetical protein